MHTCRPGHAYSVSSFIPKFWGCVTILTQQQYNRTGQVCVHIDVCSERVHPSAWKFITNPLSLYMCVFVYMRMYRVACCYCAPFLLGSWFGYHTHFAILRGVGRRDPSPSIGSSTAESLYRLSWTKQESLFM